MNNVKFVCEVFKTIIKPLKCINTTIKKRDLELTQEIATCNVRKR